jgi:hypothetical protein
LCHAFHAGSTRHAKSSSQCRRWNFIAKYRENAVRKVKIAFFLKMRYPWKFCSINYSRITVSDHFYWFPFIKSVNITFYFAKVGFFPYLLLIKIVKIWSFRCSYIKNKAANDINSSKYNSRIKKTMNTSIIRIVFSSAWSKFNKIVN